MTLLSRTIGTGLHLGEDFLTHYAKRCSDRRATRHFSIFKQQPTDTPAATSYKRKEMTNLTQIMTKVVEAKAQIATMPTAETLKSLKANSVLVIAGGNAPFAAILAREFINQHPDGKIVLTVRNEKQIIPTDNPNIHWIVFSENEYKSPLAVQAKLDAALSELGTIDELHLSSCIGAAIAHAPETLHSINVTPSMNMLKALACYAIAHQIKYFTSTLLSSIHPTIVDPSKCSYAKARDLCDKQAVGLAERFAKAHPEMQFCHASFRPGIVQGRIDSSGKETRGELHHKWDLGHFLSLPLTPVVGSGEQPAPVVASEDLAHAMVNYMTLRNGSSAEIINATTRHKYSYIELLNITANYMNTSVRPMHLPTSFIEMIVKHFPLGKAAPYSARFFKALDYQGTPYPCHKRFEELLKRDPIEFEKLFPENPGTIIRYKAPVAEHIKLTIRVLARNKTARKEFLACIKVHSGELLKELFYSITRMEKERKRKPGNPE
jgi:nucleoside-diphosphate-sugar epimerase